MILKELQRWIIKHDAEDSWWVAVDGDIQDTVMSLPDISRFKDESGDRQVSVLHVSKAEDKNAEWLIFEQDEPRVARLAPKVVQKTVATRVVSAPVVEFETARVAVEKAKVDPDIIADLRRQMESLARQVKQFQALVDDLKQPIVEARKVLEERENFLEIGETALFEKAQKQEVLQTELEQLRDDLNRREQYLDERERNSQRGQAVG